MAESNGSGEIPMSGDPRVDAALKRIRGKFQSKLDALTDIIMRREGGMEARWSAPMPSKKAAYAAKVG